MSGVEIERKFLIKRGGAYKRAASSFTHIVQGYIQCSDATVRVRLRDDKAYLTIKSKSVDNGLSRYEFETEIHADEAQQLLKLCRGGLIDKHRYLVPMGQHVFEVDEFHGKNDGLVIAEVELNSTDEPFEKPDFVGEEVTGDHRFYNSYLLNNPFCEWRDSIPAEYQ